MKKKKLVAITGAGISAESGISTFRDSNGLWENHAIEDVATPEGFEKNPALVLEFYNQRRRQLFDVSPNIGHLTLAILEADFDVVVITQNVDDLHERAGSRHVIHLHGELRKVCSSGDPKYIRGEEGAIEIGDLCPRGYQLRPYIVWFGEAVPMLYEAEKELANADVVLVIGSSMQVYPAAGLIMSAPTEALKFYIDPHPNINHEMKVSKNLEIVAEPATVGLPLVAEMLKNLI